MCLFTIMYRPAPTGVPGDIVIRCHSMLLSNVYETFNGVFDANEERDNTSALSENLLHSKRLLGTEEAILF